MSLDIDDILSRAKAEMNDHIKQKSRCENAANLLYADLKREKRSVSVGAGEIRNGPAIYVYGESSKSITGVPDTYRGFPVVTKVVGRAKAL